MKIDVKTPRQETKETLKMHPEKDIEQLGKTYSMIQDGRYQAT